MATIRFSIAFNYGRDEGSRRTKSEHRSAKAALRAWKRTNAGEGWDGRIDAPASMRSDFVRALQDLRLSEPDCDLWRTTVESLIASNKLLFVD